MSNLDLRRPKRLDRREMRAQQVVSLALMAAERTFPYDIITRRQMKAFADELQKQFMENGVEVLTDWHRTQMDLPARGPDGWTMAEIIAMDDYLLKIHAQPLAYVVEKGLQADLNEKVGGITWVAPTTQSKIE
jgi:hypothetical protein